MPKVTIGMPVYNGETQIAAALDSMLAQTMGDFELVIGDNASTDATEEICRRYCQHDPRIKYFRHDENMGATANFRFVFEQAEADYFMWAAVDDIRSADFLALNLAFLESHPNYVASTSPTSYSNGGPDPVKMGDGLLDLPTSGERLLSFLRIWHSNGALFSLFRRDALARGMEPFHHFLGNDWVVMLTLATIGPARRLDAGYVHLGGGGASSSLEILKAFRKHALHWLFPLYEVSKVALKLSVREAPATRRAVLRRLARLNYSGARIQFGYERRKWARRTFGPAT